MHPAYGRLAAAVAEGGGAGVGGLSARLSLATRAQLGALYTAQHVTMYVRILVHTYACGLYKVDAILPTRAGALTALPAAGSIALHFRLTCGGAGGGAAAAAGEGAATGHATGWARTEQGRTQGEPAAPHGQGRAAALALAGPCVALHLPSGRAWELVAAPAERRSD